MVVYPKTNQIFIFEVYGMVDISHFHSILSYKLLAPLNVCFSFFISIYLIYLINLINMIK